MSCILNIETSTDVCSVSVSQDGACIFSQEDHEGPNHAVKLGTFVDEALSFADSHAIPLDAVAVSCGQDLKLIAVPTLELMAVPVLLREEVEEGALLCPMIDARRMEVYCAVYTRALKEVEATQALVVDEHSFNDLLEQHPIYFMGNGADKCAEVIKHPNAHFIKGIVPRAKNMVPLAEMAMARQEFEDVAYFEPFYLKEFVATKSKKLL